MKYEDFNDNEYIEQMLKELRDNGTNVMASDIRHKLLRHRIHGNRSRKI